VEGRGKLVGGRKETLTYNLRSLLKALRTKKKRDSLRARRRDECMRARDSKPREIKRKTAPTKALLQRATLWQTIWNKQEGRDHFSVTLRANSNLR